MQSKFRCLIVKTTSLSSSLFLVVCIGTMQIMLNSCKTRKDELKMSNQYMGSYTVIWKYKIHQDKMDAFEHEYGLNGAWFNLFAHSENYTGSFLYRSEEEKDVYILIDTWTNRQSYEDFKNNNQEIYDKMSATFEHLYESEERIGAFHLLK